MKRYLLFSGEDYYPNGGWYDYQGIFDTIQEAKNGHTQGWAHIVDTETNCVVSVLRKEYTYMKDKYYWEDVVK